MKHDIRLIGLLLAIPIVFSGLCSCREQPGQSDGTAETAVGTKHRIAQLRAELGTDDGSSAYCELHHLGNEGFEALLQANANSEFSPDELISWSFDLATRWPEGERLGKSYLAYLSSRAEHDESLTSKLANFYSQFPAAALDDLKKHGRGAEEVALEAGKKRELDK